MLFKSLFGDSFDCSDFSISGISIDSRKVNAGDIFIAKMGETDDGHNYAEQAIKNGAIAVLSERPLALKVPNFVDPNLVPKISKWADRYFRSPSSRLRCIGVTGTNGKTSIAYFCSYLIKKCGFIGSIGWGVPGNLESNSLTTPDAISVQSYLADFRKLGLAAAAMEVSSHALSQDRVSCVKFDTAIFSNLSQDHLDYHGSMEDYGRAKKRLFTYPDLRLAVINRDDVFGQELLNYVKKRNIECLSYGFQGADISWQDVRYHKKGISGRWKTPWGSTEFHLPLYGEFSLSNAAATLAAVLCGGSDLSSTVELMSSIPIVPGRMQVLRRNGLPTVIVDYAHTPAALSAVLRAVKSHNEGYLICVFGCGGDRDKGKRPFMAEAVERLADKIFVTSDNPRNESAEQVISEIVEGFSNNKHQVFSDRREAIDAAIAEGDEGDIVLIAGKGDENFQEIGGRKYPSNDLDIAKIVLEKKALTFPVENRNP